MMMTMMIAPIINTTTADTITATPTTEIAATDRQTDRSHGMSPLPPSRGDIPTLAVV